MLACQMWLLRQLSSGSLSSREAVPQGATDNRDEYCTRRWPRAISRSDMSALPPGPPPVCRYHAWSCFHTTAVVASDLGQSLGSAQRLRRDYPCRNERRSAASFAARPALISQRSRLWPTDPAYSHRATSADIRRYLSPPQCGAAFERLTPSRRNRSSMMPPAFTCRAAPHVRFAGAWRQQVDKTRAGRC